MPPQFVALGAHRAAALLLLGSCTVQPFEEPLWSRLAGGAQRLSAGAESDIEHPGTSSQPSDAGQAESGPSEGRAFDASPGGCGLDRFEPNDEPSEAARVEGRGTLDAILCPADDLDYYRFSAPTGIGGHFSVRVRFSHARGDLDATLYSLADDGEEEEVDSSAGVTDEEIVEATSTGATYLLELSLFEASDAGGVPYRVDFFVAAAASNDCCTESETPGCSDAAERACVCEADPACCSSGYDRFCVQLAQSECGAQCFAGASESDCCAPSAAPGCAQPGVEACVCDLAPFCCAGPFDVACTELALAFCGARCSEEP